MLKWGREGCFLDKFSNPTRPIFVNGKVIMFSNKLQGNPIWPFATLLHMKWTYYFLGDQMLYQKSKGSNCRIRRLGSKPAQLDGRTASFFLFSSLRKGGHICFWIREVFRTCRRNCKFSESCPLVEEFQIPFLDGAFGIPTKWIENEILGISKSHFKIFRWLEFEIPVKKNVTFQNSERNMTFQMAWE